MKLNICYVLPSFMCCGGNRIAIEHCNRLSKKHNVFLMAINPKAYGLDWINLSSRVKVIEKDSVEIKKLDAIVATYFETVYNINELKLSKKTKKFYFAQQIESRFFNDEHSKMRAEVTYFQQDFTIFTEAAWLANEFALKYNRNVYYIPNKQELPKKLPEKIKKGKKPVILIEGDIRSKNKGVFDALLVVKNLPYEKWLLTNAQSTDLNFRLHVFFDKKFFAQSWEQALNVIRSADVLLKPSKFEGSPTPHMEAMSLGTCLVTSDCTGVDEYCIPEFNCVQYEMNSHAKMRQAVMRVVEDVELRKKLICNGKKFALKHFSWSESIAKLSNMFEKECGKHERNSKRKSNC